MVGVVLLAAALAALWLGWVVNDGERTAHLIRWMEDRWR